MSSTENSAKQLELGGYTKGYALELGLDFLQAVGIESALINAGGDLLTLGSQGSRPWQIGNQHPQRR